MGTDSADGPAARAIAEGAGIDTTVPHSARFWNYLLGGKDNFPVDRAAGDAAIAAMPSLPVVARASRQFIGRVVTYLAGEAGIRQFLDIGTGLPTADNTHEVAQRVAPESRIVYVDNDPLVLAHARALLTSTPQGATDYVDADMRDPERILAEAARTLDLSQPVAVLFMGVLGHIEAVDDARRIVRTVVAPLVPGSYLALQDGTHSEEFDTVTADYDETGGSPYRPRTPEEVKSLFDGLTFVEPGFVSITQWRPNIVELGASAEPINGYGGVARKDS
jgi:hypothetical protein